VLEEYKKMKICVLGFGVEGQATYDFLLKNGIKPAICDKDELEEFLKKHPELKEKEMDLRLGDGYLSSLDDYDLVFKAPGIPLGLDEIRQAQKQGTKITGQVEFFFEYCPCPIIGVTGTKGKGTTSSIIYQILLNSGKDAYLGGNIGIPAISFLEKLKNDSLVVLELSSFQLQSLKTSPHIAVVLNITQDHLDYHKTVVEYREAKEHIVKFQSDKDFAVINADYSITKKMAEKTKAQVFFVSKNQKTNGSFVDEDGVITLVTAKGEDKLLNANDLLLRGRHNLENVTAAVMAGYLAGATADKIIESLKEFKGLEHRLELVDEIRNIKYYNDSFSTVPETAIAAINSFEEPIVLIAGGSYKGSDYRDLGKTIAEKNVKAVILIGEMGPEIAKSIPKNYHGMLISGLEKMAEIVKKATETATVGDVVLLSPACASFGLFANYKDRGQQFKREVLKLRS
jgi:UDP-N-acetylmuramoylalanine--D-glutamate ligase